MNRINKCRENWRWTGPVAKGMAYVYLMGGFCFMGLWGSYAMGSSVRPIGLFLTLLIIASMFTLYAILNHLIVRLVVSHKTLALIELLTLMITWNILVKNSHLGL